MEKADWEKNPEQYFPFSIDRYFSIEGELVHWSAVQEMVIRTLEYDSDYVEYMMIRMMYMCYRIIVWGYNPTQQERSDAMLGNDKSAIAAAEKVWHDISKNAHFTLGFSRVGERIVETIEPLGKERRKNLSAMEYYLMFCIARGKELLISDGYEIKCCENCYTEFAYPKTGRSQKYCPVCRKRIRTIQRNKKKALEQVKEGGNSDGIDH